jgi:glutamyl-tRNA reductase
VSVLLVGLSHRTAPVDLLELTSLADEALDKLLADVVAGEHATEALVLSTCNRVEVYAEVDKFHGGLAEVSDLLARYASVPLEVLTQHLYVHYEDRAVAHLFAVACGLESMVVGEGQILGQLKVALRSAQEAGTAGRVLNELGQQALRVGKRARTETGIDRAGRSLVTAGLDLAEQLVGPLPDQRVLVVGAGSMSALATSVVAARGAAQVTVVNRTLAHADRVASASGGRARPMDELSPALAEADLVVTCTGAVGHVVPADSVAAAVETRAGRPLLLLDLALPRDVEPSVADLPGVTVVDLERLGEVLSTQEHAGDVAAATAIVADEVTGFLAWQRAATVAPTVVALRGMAGQVVRAELTRLTGRLPDLDARARAEIESTVQRVVDKVLHMPTVRVKQLAGEPGGHAYADALSKLFGLDPKTIEAMTRADVEGEGR